MAENGYGLAGQGMGKVKSINQYRLTPGFGGFTPVSGEPAEFGKNRTLRFSGHP
ncbi:TPA: hypothetical protein ACQJVI_004690 [Escherichia coli]